MWLMTVDGFYSVVQKPGEVKLSVRAREEKDLIALRNRYLPGIVITRSDATDYQWRTKVSRKEFAEAVSKIVMDITYSNFKGAVSVRDKRREGVYHKIWQCMADEYGCYGSVPHRFEPHQSFWDDERQAHQRPELLTPAQKKAVLRKLRD